MLEEKEFEMGERGLALTMARMSTLDLSIILNDYAALKSWNKIVRKYAIDLTGHEEVKELIDLRDALQ